MKQTLAFRMRPKTFDEVIGQDHLVGKNGIIRKFLEKDILPSLILYGPPGTGKTTIAEILSSEFGLNSFKFNASIDNKKKLTEIITHTKLYGNALLIIDEIHRMNKDIQDYLLPYVEDSTIIMVGITTVNPYHSINPAIRSRVHILKLEEITKSDILKALHLALKNGNLEYNFIPNDTLEYIASIASGEIRYALNMLEMVTILYPNEPITIDKATKVLNKPNVNIDKDGNDYYDTLSGLQKSIRGSDVNASLHYLAKLLVMDDLISLTRRLMVIAYEDIGLANPGIGPKVVSACDAALKLGMPEARIPLATVCVDMALSPKSNSALSALDQALSDIFNGLSGEIPLHLKNVPHYSSSKADSYKYPHDYKDALVKQEYLPKTLKGKVYYTPKFTGKYERALADRLKIINDFMKNNK